MTIAEMNEPFAKGINLIIAQKKLKKHMLPKRLDIQVSSW